jgi:hypothetical protein
MENDEKNKLNWKILKDNGIKKIYPSHGEFIEI